MNVQPQSPQAGLYPQTLTMKDVCKTLRPRPVDAHKGIMGHALLVTGSKGMAGAAILASRGCLRSGIGKLTVHTPSANNVILQCSVPEAILHLDTHEALITANVETSNFQAIGIGPGIGTAEATAEAVRHYLESWKGPLVLDADALNIIAQHPGWENLILPHTIITPHIGEFQRLTHKCESQEERTAVAKAYAKEHNIYIVLKGHPSIVCTPDEETYSCPYGNSGMATPGSGDVLTGLITGLLTQGYSAKHACILGTWLHAIAGDIAAQELGEEYMLASDIVTHLANAFKELKRQAKMGDTLIRDNA